MLSTETESRYGGWRRHGLQTLAIVALMVVAPLVGVLIVNGDPGDYLRFPPRPIEPAPGSFVPLAFALYAILILATLLPFVIRVLRANAHHPSAAPASVSPRPAFPRWGWLSLIALGVFWVIAWVPIPGLETVRRLSFTPLWVAYVGVISAWIQRRGGRVLVIEQPRRFLALFPASALFWYLFEYLNQFTGNWIYTGTGVAENDALNWFLRSALPFSTVLPAVLVTRDLFATWPGLSRGLDQFLQLRPSRPERTAKAVLIAGALGLVAIAIRPDAFYALVWVAPPLLIVAIQGAVGERHLFSGVAGGNWRDPWLAVLAALFCGFCWELWNIFSLARWTYHIPNAQILHVFEMPLLGYAGYLPFGLTCVVAAQLLTGTDPRARTA
ncbi:hypothetical protein SPICUR_07040 [Spiribacter curvatus]|uniref:Small-conductance mechanosensitive channel n=1 Tax=Spiribacter curvatus TaxID=1335757 RepID=U5T501_9GAMM|nr:hypothetical protein [Spiribacter curvatus]AGY92371.1 hypothetical protein SPICUR_07040 [Spiribacter curvatus]